MRVVVQRAKNAAVYINEKINGQIESGLVILIGIEEIDTRIDADWLVQKLINMRIFSDENGKMNLSIKETQGSFLVISQFTLFASTKKGNRPGFTRSASPAHAVPLYEYFIELLKKESGLKVETGQFGADMQVQLTNDGPVTILIDTQDKE